MFPSGDVGAAAAHLVRLAGNADLRKEVGGRLRARQERLFSLEVHVDRLEIFYASVFARSGR
jgi:glycosyltransferase involved in cell wall biosynthesis